MTPNWFNKYFQQLGARYQSSAYKAVGCSVQQSKRKKKKIVTFFSI